MVAGATHLRRYFLRRLRLQNQSKMRSHFHFSQAPIGAFLQNLRVRGHKCPAHRHRVATHRRTPLGVLQPVSRFWFSRTSTLGGLRRQGLQQLAFAGLRPETQSASVLSSLHRLPPRLCKRVTTALPRTVVCPLSPPPRPPLTIGRPCAASDLKGYHVWSFPQNTAQLRVRLSPHRCADFYSDPAPGHQLAHVSRRKHMAVSLTAYG